MDGEIKTYKTAETTMEAAIRELEEAKKMGIKLEDEPPKEFWDGKLTKEEIEADAIRAKEQEEYWRGMSKERLRMFGDIIAKDEGKDSDVG